MPDAVAYIIYLSILRALTYPEPEAYSVPFQRFALVRVIQNSSIFRIRGIFRALSNTYDGAFLPK